MSLSKTLRRSNRQQRRLVSQTQQCNCKVHAGGVASVHSKTNLSFFTDLNFPEVALIAYLHFNSHFSETNTCSVLHSFSITQLIFVGHKLKVVSKCHTKLSCILILFHFVKYFFPNRKALRYDLHPSTNLIIVWGKSVLFTTTTDNISSLFQLFFHLYCHSLVEAIIIHFPFNFLFSEWHISLFYVDCSNLTYHHVWWWYILLLKK